MKGHQHWIERLSNYLPNRSDKDIIKYCMSYTLQSFRYEEDMNRFKWGGNNGESQNHSREK